MDTGLVLEPRNHSLVFNGVPGHIQFYNTASDRHVVEVEVAPAYRYSAKSKVTTYHVDHVAFHPSGGWMATLDSRDDKETTPERYLKFWRWDHDQQTYKLHTRVDKPHNGHITSLTFSPSLPGQPPMAITTSADKVFKVWHLLALGRSHGEDEVAWTCRSNGMYRNYVPTQAAFSTDGSILAVSFGSHITLWDPQQNSIQRVLVQPVAEDIQRLHFIGDSPFVVAVSQNYFCVWNLLTCTGRKRKKGSILQRY